MKSGTISKNRSAGDGGGIYTMDYSYENSADTSKYKNIEIGTKASVQGNTSGATNALPDNHTDFTWFPGKLLNNDGINYKGAYLITYIANNGTDVSEIREATSGTSDAQATLLTESEAGFVPPVTGAKLIGWNTEADGSGTAYTLGETIPISDYLTLYAVWESISYTVNVEYYYLDDDGNPVYMNTAAGTTVIEGEMVTIDITSAYITEPGYTAWYYTVGPDHDVRYYFEDAGDEYGGIYDNITIRVYAVSTRIDVVLPNDSFFWYANEDTSTIVDYLIDPVTGQVTSLNGKDVVYEIRSKAYSIENNGLTPVTVELKGYVQDGSNREIEELLYNSTSDRLFLNLTGDLEDDPTGLDLLQQDPASDPFGTYTEPLGAGESWQYSFGGFYYPSAEQLPTASAVSDYKLTFGLELDLSDPDL